MIRNARQLKPVLYITVFAMVACTSTKTSQGEVSTGKEATQTGNECEQAIRYYVDKIVMIKDSREVAMPAEIVINPKTKLISLSSKPPDGEPTNFDTVIESIDCDLTSGFTKGQSTYKGYIKQKDGSTTSAAVKVETKNGELVISNGDPNQVTEFVMHVARWELIKE